MGTIRTSSAEGRKYYERTWQVVTIAPRLARLGVIRLFDLDPVPHGLPRQQRAQVEVFGSSTQQFATAAEEFRAILETSARVRSMNGLGDKPLVVISAGESSPATSRSRARTTLEHHPRVPRLIGSSPPA